MEPYGRSRPIVLVVDDDASVRSAFALILEDACEVREAADATAALGVLIRETVDLVLLDVLMPGMGGLELRDRLRTAVPAVPVVLVTALDEARTAVTAMKLGAFDYLTKPFEPEELLSVARRALAARLEAPKITLVGGDVGTRANIAVLLRIWWPVEVPAGRR